MDFEKPCCPIVDIDGNIACGKQFDLDITLPCDNRNVIYGVIRDCYKEPVADAVVKLIEVVCECGKEERRPVSHTFTDEEGEFVFGPLCPDKKYEINFWVDQVKHIKVCAKCNHEGRCLKGVRISIMVPTSYFRSMPAAAISASAVLTTTSITYFSSLMSPTRGIMISGTLFQSG